jgi:hypothetical protein
MATVAEMVRAQTTAAGLGTATGEPDRDDHDKHQLTQHPFLPGLSTSKRSGGTERTGHHCTAVITSYRCGTFP